MIKNEEMLVNISYRNKTHYVKLGYVPIINKKLKIKTEDLPSSSHVRIDVICEICQKENNIQYHKYLVNKQRHGFYGCKSCSRQKAALTSLSKYGVDNYSKTDEFKRRVEKTNIEKYGFKTNLISPEYKGNIKQILKDKYGTENWYEIRNGNGSLKSKRCFELNENIYDLISDVTFSEDRYDDSIISNDYLLYRRECRRYSYKPSKELFENWDGKDYYDGEDISGNLSLDHNDPNYPTIDHKISIYHGFINDILPEEISKLSNLCITKRSINSSKRDMIESKFFRNDI